MRTRRYRQVKRSTTPQFHKETRKLASERGSDPEMSKGSPEILYTENDPRNLSHESEDLEDTAFFRFSSSADDLIVSPLGNYGSSPLRAMSSNSLYGEDIVNSGGHAFLNSDDLVSPSEFSEAGIENASTPPSRATNMSLSPPPLHGETMSYSSKANSRSRPPRIPANTARSTGGGTHPPKQQPHSTSISHQQQSLLTTHVRGNSHVRGGSIGDASMMSALTDGSFEPELPRHLPQPVSHNAANRSPTSMNIEVRSSTVDPTLTSVPPALQQPVLSDLEERTPPASLKVFPSPKSSTPYSGSHRIPSSPLVPDSLSPIQNEAVSLIAEAMKEQASHSNEIRLAFTTSDHVAKEPEQLNVSALRRLSSLLELLENENGLVSPKTLKRTFEFLMKVPQNAKRNRPIPSRWFFLEIGPVIVYVVFLLSDYLSQYLSYYMNTTARYAFIFLGVSILLRRLLSSAIRTFQTRRLLPSLNEAIEDLLFLIELEYFHRFISTSHDDSRTSSTVRTSQWRASGYVSGQNSDGSADESLVHDTKSVDLKMLRQHFEFGNDCRPVLVKALARIVTSDENCEKRRKSIELLFDYLVGRKGAMDVSLSHMLTVNAAFTTFSETQMRTIVRRLFGSPKRLQKEHFCSMVECRLRQVSVLIRTLDCDNYVQSSIVRAYELLAILSVIGGMISQYNLILSPILSIFVGVLLTALLLYVDNIEVRGLHFLCVPHLLFSHTLDSLPQGVVFLLFRRSFDVGDRVRLLSSTNDKVRLNDVHITHVGYILFSHFSCRWMELGW